jgi:glycosyltransferase involved in cell wall biosynthesis
MRVLHVAQTFGLYDAEGRTGHIAPLAARLTEAGVDISVIAAGYPPHSPAGSVTVGEGTMAFPVTYLNSGLRYRTLTINPGARAFFETVIRTINLVHIHGLYDLLGPAAAAVSRDLNIPYIVETMGMFRPVAGGALRKRAFMRLFGRSMIRGAARFVATSGREADDLASGGIAKDRIDVRPNGVDPVAIPPGAGPAFRSAHGIGAETPFVLFLGRISPVKNIELLLAAFARLTASDAVLVIAGPDEGTKYPGLLRDIAGSPGLAGRVNFVGSVYGEHKAAALAEAAMLVLPSVNENFGTVAVEAMALGTPAVVTETCGVAEHLRDAIGPKNGGPRGGGPGGGGLVVALDAADMRTAIDRLLSNDALRSEMGDRAKAIASTLTWEEAARLTNEMYERILGK